MATTTVANVRTWDIHHVFLAADDTNLDPNIRDHARQELATRHIRMYSEFIDDAEEFVVFLDDNGVVVSGSFVLKYIEGDSGPVPNDMDLFTNQERFPATIAFFSARGYILINEDDLTRNTTKYRVAIEVAKMRRGDRLVDIVKTATVFPPLIMTQFWSTLQMNYLTGSYICMLYPALTLKRVGLLTPRWLDDDGDPTARTCNLITKYKTRGYQFYTDKTISPQDWFPPTSVWCPKSITSTTIRRDRDEHCLVIAWKPIQAVHESSGREVQWTLGGWDGTNIRKGWVKLVDYVEVEYWAFDTEHDDDGIEIAL